MSLTPQLALGFNGNCEAALRFYERCLGGTITFLLTYADSPMSGSVADDWGGKVCHATLKIGDTAILAADQPDGRYVPPQGFELVVPFSDPVEAERVFDELADGGYVKMPLQETFWASRFGLCVDRFGISWAINCEPQ